jgi:hypothetical protein
MLPYRLFLELALMGEFDYRFGLDCFIDELVMLARSLRSPVKSSIPLFLS